MLVFDKIRVLDQSLTKKEDFKIQYRKLEKETMIILKIFGKFLSLMKKLDKILFANFIQNFEMINGQTSLEQLQFCNSH